MFRISLVLITILFSANGLFSQNVRLSVTGNPQFIWLVSDNQRIKNEGILPGINNSLEIDFFFADRYAFSTGISLDNLGGRFSHSDTIVFIASGTTYPVPAGTEIINRFQYLGVRMGLKLKTQEIGYFTYVVGLGFTPMVNLRSRAGGDIIPDKSDFSEETRLFNMNYFFSAGTEYSLGGSTSLIGGAGYSSGFLDVTARPDEKVTTRSLFIRLGILF